MCVCVCVSSFSNFAILKGFLLVIKPNLYLKIHCILFVVVVRLVDQKSTSFGILAQYSNKYF